MTARIGIVALVLVTAALLQTALFPFLPLAGFRPDLLVLVTVAFALRDGPGTGLRVGFAAGLLADLLLYESAVGLSALVMLGIGYAVGAVRPYLAAESVSAPVILAFVAGVLGTGGYGVLAGLLGQDRYTLDLVLRASLFVGVYDALLAPIVVGFVTRLTRRFPAQGAAAIRSGGTPA